MSLRVGFALTFKWVREDSLSFLQTFSTARLPLPRPQPVPGVHFQLRALLLPRPQHCFPFLTCLCSSWDSEDVPSCGCHSFCMWWHWHASPEPVAGEPCWEERHRWKCRLHPVPLWDPLRGSWPSQLGQTQQIHKAHVESTNWHYCN